MKRILYDFCLAELRGITALLCCIALLLAYLIFFAGVPPVYALVLPLLAVLVLLRAAWQTARFRKTFEAFPAIRQERLANDYAAPHPCIPVYQGELHLLSDCLLCRSRRTLHLLPMEKLALAEVERHTGRSRMVIDLILTGLSGKSVCIEFIGSGQKQLGEIAAHLEAQGVPFDWAQ